jgi:branched-chain amino acid transport system permease protein
MMRFRPEGLIASRRRQLEFHEEDEELAVRTDEEIQQTPHTPATKEATV